MSLAAIVERMYFAGIFKLADACGEPNLLPGGIHTLKLNNGIERTYRVTRPSQKLALGSFTFHLPS